MYKINANSSVPLFEQIEQKTKLCIASGAFPEGKRIPSIRDIAKEFTTKDEDGEIPCEVLYGGDRLAADEYIKSRMAELMPDVNIDLGHPEGFTVEIN